MEAVEPRARLDEEPPARLLIAVVGAGRRGTGVARAFQGHDDWEVAAVCDVELDRAARLSSQLGDIPCFETIDESLDSVELDAVAIATPLRALHGTAMTALRAGKHVLLEEPLADSMERGKEMCSEAAGGGLIVMANHPYCFEPAVHKIQKLLDTNSLGEILFLEALRTETNLLQTDGDVFWDLAPGSLAVLDHILPDGLAPREVSAFGGDPLGTGRDCVGYVSFRLPNDAPVHLNVNRLSRARNHQLVIAGTRLTLVWDATVHEERLRIYDPSALNLQPYAPYRFEPELLQLPVGEGQLAALEQEALCRLATEFASRIRGNPGRFSPVSPSLGVLAMLEGIARSRCLDGQASPVASGDRAVLDVAGSRLNRVLWSS